MKKYFSLVLLLVLVPSLALAAELKTGNRYFLPERETVVGNLYVGSGEATVVGAVNGDLYVGAGTTLVSGIVKNDLVVTGGTVTVTGEVGGDLRVVGGNVVVTGPVRGDVFVIGGSLNMSGLVGGSLDFIGGTLSIGDGAYVRGDVTYRSNVEAKISSQAVIGGKITYDKRLAKSLGVVKEAGSKSILSGFAALFGVWVFLKLLMLLFASLVFYWLFLPYLELIVHKTFARPGPALATGFIALVVAPALALVLIISIIGLPLACLLGLTYLILLMVAKLSAGAIIGAWGEKLIYKHAGYKVSWQGVLLGTLVLFIISYIPIIGWIASHVLILTVFGATIDILYRNWLH